MRLDCWIVGRGAADGFCCGVVLVVVGALFAVGVVRSGSYGVGDATGARLRDAIYIAVGISGDCRRRQLGYITIKA